MIVFNALAWYWFVGADLTRVWSSAANAYVPATDPQFIEWSATNPASRVASEAELVSVLTSRAPDLVPSFPAGLLAYAARLRWEKEVGGISFGVVNVATDDRSKTMLMGVHIAAQADASFRTAWVGADGAITQIDAPTAIAVSNAVLSHVQACFNAFSKVAAGIAATPPTITSKAQVDAAFVGVG